MSECEDWSIFNSGVSTSQHCIYTSRTTYGMMIIEGERIQGQYLSRYPNRSKPLSSLPSHNASTFIPHLFENLYIIKEERRRVAECIKKTLAHKMLRISNEDEDAGEAQVYLIGQIT